MYGNHRYASVQTVAGSPYPGEPTPNGAPSQSIRPPPPNMLRQAYAFTRYDAQSGMRIAATSNGCHRRAATFAR
jgi:hypothetical protein